MDVFESIFEKIRFEFEDHFWDVFESAFELRFYHSLAQRKCRQPYSRIQQDGKHELATLGVGLKSRGGRSPPGINSQNV